MKLIYVQFENCPLIIFFVNGRGDVVKGIIEINDATSTSNERIFNERFKSLMFRSTKSFCHLLEVFRLMIGRDEFEANYKMENAVVHRLSKDKLHNYSNIVELIKIPIQ